MKKNELFNQCEICNTNSWKSLYEGRIRSGCFGSFDPGAVGGTCSGCSVGRLAESNSISSKAYETKEYRDTLGQGLNVSDFFDHADPVQVPKFWSIVFIPEPNGAKSTAG